ncbi:MFS transporter [Metallococcus carri]|nr:MFS transporter [Metallococcus carri]
MLLVGASSGAADVAINALAGRAEHVSDRPLITRSAGLFSVGVVLASLGTGALLGAGLSLIAVFGVVAAAILALALTTHLTSAPLHLPPHDSAAETDDHNPRVPPTNSIAPLLAVGLIAALAYAVENAHQSWGAVMLTDVFRASPQVAAAAPAAFAATAAVARLTLAPLSRSHPTAILLGGGTLAAAGSVVLATAPSVAVALVGLVLAALGTATLFPTLLSRSLRGVAPAQHGRATSTIGATAYLGFLLGPAYVGALTEVSDLRGALLGVAALALLFTLAATPISAWAAGHRRMPGRRSPARAR